MMTNSGSYEFSGTNIPIYKGEANEMLTVIEKMDRIIKRSHQSSVVSRKADS